MKNKKFKFKGCKQKSDNFLSLQKKVQQLHLVLNCVNCSDFPLLHRKDFECSAGTNSPKILYNINEELKEKKADPRGEYM